MTIQKQIKDYIASQSELNCNKMTELHRIILKIKSDSKLWFLEVKNSANKVVSNPNSY